MIFIITNFLLNKTKYYSFRSLFRDISGGVKIEYFTKNLN